MYDVMVLFYSSLYNLETERKGSCKTAVEARAVTILEFRNTYSIFDTMGASCYCAVYLPKLC